MTKENHFLPPDNFQEEPAPVIAHRSSPTNFGLYLLSVVAARDFGWISLHEMASRLEATLDGMDALPRHRGHFLNWIDTLTLRPLEPRYVSTVDSGNLAAMLLVLSQACNEAVNRPVPEARAMAGIGDEVALLRVLLLTRTKVGSLPAWASTSCMTHCCRVEGLLESPALEPHDRDQRFVALEAAAADVHDIVTTLASESKAGELSEAVLWAAAMLSNVRGQRHDRLQLAPWMEAGGGERFFGRQRRQGRGRT